MDMSCMLHAARHDTEALVYSYYLMEAASNSGVNAAPASA